jgi:hypothetical protein
MTKLSQSTPSNHIRHIFNVQTFPRLLTLASIHESHSAHPPYQNFLCPLQSAYLLISHRPPLATMHCKKNCESLCKSLVVLLCIKTKQSCKYGALHVWDMIHFSRYLNNSLSARIFCKISLLV